MALHWRFDGGTGFYMGSSSETFGVTSAPILGLEKIVVDADPEVKKLFQTALNTFAGPYASTQAYKDKKDGLERVIRGN